MTRRLMVLAAVLVLVVFVGQMVQAQESDVECVGRCQRRDRLGRCRPIFGCNVEGPVTEESIFNVPCRRRCYSLVRGRCRLKFSCLLG